MKHLKCSGIQCVSKGGGISTDQVVNIFNSTDDIEAIKATVQRAEERVYTSWASVEVKDLAGEVIPMADLAAQQEKLMARGGPLMDEHSNRLVGNTLAYKVMTHPESGRPAVLHLNRIFDMGNPVDDEVWAEIRSGERKGSSVGGVHLGDERVSDPETGEPITAVRDFYHMETSSVFEPCNPLALDVAFSAVAKSADPGVKKNMARFLKEVDARIKAALGTEKIDGIINEAYAAAYPEESAKTQNLANVIKDPSHKKGIQPEPGDKTMDEDKLTKTLSDIQKGQEEMLKLAQANSEQIRALQESQKMDDPKDDEEDDEDEKSTKKEDASSEVAGNEGEASPEAPEPDQPNDDDAFGSEATKTSTKKGVAMETEMEKKVAELTKSVDDRLEAISSKVKSLTPRPGAQRELTKAEKEFSEMPMKIALGQTKKSWAEVQARTKAEYGADNPATLIPGVM